MIENKKAKIFKHLVINDVEEDLIDKYTIVDFSQSRIYYKRDKRLISNFIDILEDMHKSLSNITKMNIDNLLSNKLDKSIKKDKLYIFFENILKNIWERSNIEDLYVIFKNKLSLMIKNIEKYKKTFKELSKKTSDLNTKLTEFKKNELEFKEKTEKDFSEMIGKWDKKTSNEMKEKRNKVYGNFKKDHEEYLKSLEIINQAIIPYTEAQNNAIKSSGENLSYLVKYIYEKKIINDNEKDAYEKTFFYEEEAIEDFYRRNKKFNKVSPFSWREFIIRNIRHVDKESAFELINEIILYFIKDEEDSSYLLEKNNNFYLFHQIFFGEKKDKKLSEVVIKDSQRRELLDFLNIKRMVKLKLPEELITQISEILLELQKQAIEEKNYKLADLIYVISSTYYYENKERKKIYISEIIKDKEPFKNEEFIVNMIGSLLRDELKKTKFTDIAIDNTITTKITSSLGALNVTGFDKNFVKNISTKVLKHIGFDENIDKEKIQFYECFVDGLYLNAA